MVKSCVVEVEVGSADNSDLLFRPIGVRARGRVDLSQSRTQSAQQIRQRWPDPIPGQVLGIDLDTGEKYLREPLHDEQHAELRQLIIDRGHSLPKERVEYESEDLVTWVYWLKRAVESGNARIITGTLPPVDQLVGEPKKSFISPAVKGTDEKLADQIEANTAMIGELSDLIKELVGAIKSKRNG